MCEQRRFLDVSVLKTLADGCPFANGDRRLLAAHSVVLCARSTTTVESDNLTDWSGNTTAAYSETILIAAFSDVQGFIWWQVATNGSVQPLTAPVAKPSLLKRWFGTNNLVINTPRLNYLRHAVTKPVDPSMRCA